MSENGWQLVDIGIGGGRFMTEAPTIPPANGHDIHPIAVDWLKTHGRCPDPYEAEVAAMSFWDSLEHIHNPSPLLHNARRMVFVSMPIYEDCEHVLRSKHFRKDEHCLYMTHSGILAFMDAHGFDCLENNRMEEACGREDIGTYVFRRRD